MLRYYRDVYCDLYHVRDIHHYILDNDTHSDLNKHLALDDVTALSVGGMHDVKTAGADT